MKLCKLIIICLLLLFSVIVFKVSAVAFEDDTLYLFENGKRITDSSIIVTHDIYKKVCIGGNYARGQQFSTNLVFYKTKESQLMDYGEWIEYSYLKDKNCRGYATQKKEWEKAAKQFDENNKDYYMEIQKRVGIANTLEERQKIWDEWSDKRNTFMHEKGFIFFNNPECYKYGTNEYDAYLQSHIDNAIYNTTTNIPEAIDKEVHNAPPFPLVGGLIGTSRCFNVDIKTGEVKQTECIK